MAKPSLARKVDHELLLNAYRKMLELRLFELKVQELYRNARLPGFVHLYVGEEAVAVGVCMNLEDKDLVFSTHRGHGHALAKGVPADVVLAELWGKVTGSSGGRGGSMHMYAPEWGFMGTNGIVGAPIPLATGGALSAKAAPERPGRRQFLWRGRSKQWLVSRSSEYGHRLGSPRRIRLREQFVCHRNGIFARNQEHQRSPARRVVRPSRSRSRRSGRPCRSPCGKDSDRPRSRRGMVPL